MHLSLIFLTSCSCNGSTGQQLTEVVLMARTMLPISTSIALASVIYSSAAKAAVDSLCYTRDGQVDVEGQPCDPSAETSHCCHGEDHICLSNNLCYDATNNHVSESIPRSAILLGGSCTDILY